MKLVSPYRGPEKNCGDRLKVLNIQTWDMCDRHNLQVYEILSVIKTSIDESATSLNGKKNPPSKAPKSGSSCGDDNKTKTKYRGPEKTISAAIQACRHQIDDMIFIDGLSPSLAFNLIKDLVEYHIIETDG